MTFTSYAPAATVDFELVLPQGIQKIDSLYWVCQEETTPPEDWKFMERVYLYPYPGGSELELKDPQGIYIILDNPVQVMRKNLRVEVLNIVYQIAQGISSE